MYLQYLPTPPFSSEPLLTLLLSCQLLERHRAMDSMVELLQVYPEEDQAYGELLEDTTQLYQYLLQPFRDMRELAMLRRQQIKVQHDTVRQTLHGIEHHVQSMSHLISTSHKDLLLYVAVVLKGVLHDLH